MRPLHFLVGLALLLIAPVACAEEPAAAALPLSDEATMAELLKPVPPKEPHEVLATFEAAPGFHLELAAHEPLVCSPVAAAFDEDGRMYVAEMRDYPFRPAAGEPPLGRVRMLEDRDGDGVYDRSSVLADELLWPTGVMPWKGGVFVAAAPSIYYLRDTDGDGRADERRVVFTGFGTQNEQGSVNNLVWGLDNRIYGSSSKNGGAIRLGEKDANDKTSVLGRDFRFDPHAPALEPVSGNGQFGIAFDDWGRRFLCDQANPDEVVILPLEYLRRNPHLAVSRVTDDPAAGVVPIFRSSPLEGWRVIRSTRRMTLGERSEKSSGASHDVIDGAAGVGIYRGHALPEELRGQLLVGDAQNNVVHRRRLIPKGVSFDSERVDEATEFVRSTDNWFRPVNAINAPDGTLYLCDMSREQIESVHVPLDVWQRVDLTRGRDRGRIYRLAPDGFQPPPRPRLSQATAAELVALLEHAGGWQRETAQRLLYERQDPAAVAPLQALLRSSQAALARLHALYALAGLWALTDDDLTHALADPQPQIRQHALALCDGRVGENSALLRRAAELADDDDLGVRMQAAFTLGQATGAAATTVAAPALARILIRDGADYWLRTAALSSSLPCSAELAVQLLDHHDYLARGDAPETLRQLAYQVGRGDAAPAAAFCDALAQRAGDAAVQPHLPLLVAGAASGLRAQGAALTELPVSPAASELLRRLLEAARLQAADAQAPSGLRIAAAKLLAFDPFTTAREPLFACVDPRQPEWLIRPAIETLVAFDEPEIAGRLLGGWRQYLPPVRAAVLDALAIRPAWTDALLSAVERGDVLPQQVTASQQRALVRHRDEALRTRAEKLFSADTGPRSETIAAYKPSLALAADKARGQGVFIRECQACHKLGSRGHAVGPNLALVRNRTPEQLLIHILDPNREVQPAYLQYVVATVDGAVYSGMVAADSGSSLTLRRENGAEHTVLKEQIDEFSSAEKSLMPEGFEKTITPAEMADLLAYLGEMLYDIGTEPGHDEPADATLPTAEPTR